MRTISSFSNVINNKSRQRNAIQHYVNKHGHVPLWVLVNFLTFGDLNYFYQIMTDDLRTTISKDFANYQRREYTNKFINGISPEALDTTNHLVNHFRNAVAHGEITFSKHITKTPSLRYIKISLDDLSIPLENHAGVFELLVSLQVVLKKKDYRKLYKNIFSLIEEYKDDFKSISFNSILNDMNFPQNYEEYLRFK